MDRYALDAASQDEDAAASVGIDVTRAKLKITAISSAMCAFGGAMFGQYQMYIGPETIAGLGISLNMVFACIAGGMGVMLGPTFGAFFTQILSEVLRILIQSSAWLKVDLRLERAGARSGDLRAAADPVHHLHAQGHPGHAGRLASETELARHRNTIF